MKGEVTTGHLTQMKRGGDVFVCVSVLLAQTILCPLILCEIVILLRFELAHSAARELLRLYYTIDCKCLNDEHSAGPRMF